jgi:hypothetical protein
MCFFILILARNLFDWPITKSSERLEVPPVYKSIYSKHKIILRAYPFLETLLKGKIILAGVTGDWLVCSRFSFPRHLV